MVLGTDCYLGVIQVIFPLSFELRLTLFLQQLTFNDGEFNVVQSVHYVAVLNPHVLGGCPSALMQGRFTFHHNQVLYCLASELSNFVTGQCMLSVYADLPGMQASDSPQTTIPPSLLIVLILLFIIK